MVEKVVLGRCYFCTDNVLFSEDHISLVWPPRPLWNSDGFANSSITPQSYAHRVCSDNNTIREVTEIFKTKGL